MVWALWRTDIRHVSFGKQKTILGPPALSLVTVLTELSLFLYGCLTNYARSSHVPMLLARLANRCITQITKQFMQSSNSPGDARKSMTMLL